MEPAMKVAIAALIISFFSLISTIINSVFTAKTYKKNRRLEFLQRRDHLAQKISDLNDRNTETHLISARYELVALRKATLPLRDEQAELNKPVVASIKELREGVEKRIKFWDEKIEKLHFNYSNLTLESNAPRVESMIVNVQLDSDNLKKENSGNLATLHIFETTNEFIKTTLAETDEERRQIDLDFESAIKKLTKSDR